MAIWNQVVESECRALLEANAQSPRFEFDRLDTPNDEYVRILSEPGKKTAYQRTTLFSTNPLSNNMAKSQDEDEEEGRGDDRASLVASELVDPLNLANRPPDLGVLLRYCPPVRVPLGYFFPHLMSISNILLLFQFNLFMLLFSIKRKGDYSCSGHRYLGRLYLPSQSRR
jgi:hypothetical protein